MQSHGLYRIALILTGSLLFPHPVQAGETDAEALRNAFERVVSTDCGAEGSAFCERLAEGEPAACETSGQCTLECDCMPAGELLAYTLKSDEGAWEVLAPMVRERFAASSTSEVERARVLDLVCGAAYGAGMELAHELYAEEADSFGVDHLLALASANAYGWKTKQKLYGGSYGAGEDAEEHETPFADALRAHAREDVRAAAFLAFRGDDRGRSTLRRAVRTPELEESCLDLLVASLALDEGGQEGAFAEAQQAVHSSVLDALDAGQLQRARALSTQAELVYGALERGQALQLGFLERSAGTHALQRANDLAEADQVFELIERITPLG